MKKLLVFVFCVVPLIDARSLEGRETDKCVADYLKSRKLISSEFGSENPVNLLCSVVVQTTQQRIMKNVEEIIFEDENMRNETDCMIELMQQGKFADDMLVIYFYETLDIAASPKIQDKIKEAQRKGNEITINSFISCGAEEKFGKSFEELFNDQSSSEEKTEDKEDYCIRKHVVDNNLINKNHLKLEVNPKNLDISEIDCNVLYQKGLKEAEDELVKVFMDNSSEEDDNSEENPNAAVCLLKVIRKENFIDKMLKFDYIKEFTLTPEIKLKLRSEFIELMTKISLKTVKCFM